MSSIRTMKYLGEDSWDRPVYLCLETKTLYKDTTLGSDNPQLYSCDNQVEGEPSYPIQSDLKIVYEGLKERREEKHNYMMLGRLQSDCEYYLNWGNRSVNRLYYNSVEEHIKEMKKLHRSFVIKPIWLTMKQILEYEERMKGEK